MSDSPIDGLVDFLVEARRQTYAIPHGEKLADGTEQMVWDRGIWSYRDRYAGQNPYGGHELVWCDGRVVWMKNYMATVLTDHPPMGEIYAFQRTVLGDPDPDHLMRGPASYVEGPFVYRNTVDGDIFQFSGVETISHDGIDVYRMIFHGGLIGT